MSGKFLLNDKTEYNSFFSDRYTSSKDGQSVYASLLTWPNNSTEITLGEPVSLASTTVTLLGSNDDALKWRSAGASGIIIDVSNIKKSIPSPLIGHGYLNWKMLVVLN
jgi:hypothetical protein